MKRTAVALIDGEHYPPVVVAALSETSDRFDYRAALFLGGSEKIRSRDLEGAAERIYGLPVVFAKDWRRGLAVVIERYAPEVIVDLSDEPVLGYEQRFRMISETLSRNVGYEGSDFHFRPSNPVRLSNCASLSIVGTGKRVGKTALSGFVARALLDGTCRDPDRPGVVIVSMGRGGPERPEVIDGASCQLGSGQLLAWSRDGRHAASDHFEDAVLSRVTTVGCRRCGGGMAGAPFVSNVPEGALLANSLKPEFTIFEGSGSAMPPVGTDCRLLVASAQQPLEYVTGYLGTYRVLVSDSVVLAMAEEPLASSAKVQAVIAGVRAISPDLPVVPVVFRPRPQRSVEGKKVAFFCTAPEIQKKVLARYLAERWGCVVDSVSTNLADRESLMRDLAELGRVDVVATEIKAAAIDVVAVEAEKRGLDLVFVDNEPLEAAPARPGELLEEACRLGGLARERFKARV